MRSLQSALARLTYLPNSGIDGIFGMQTWHAVVAFRGWSWLARDGIVGSLTSRGLSRARRPTPWSAATGIEIHLAQQVLLLVRNGVVQRAIHVSTRTSRTATPLGHLRTYSRDPMSWSRQFHTWMPLAQYFYRGYGSTNTQACRRIPRRTGVFGCPRPKPEPSGNLAASGCGCGPPATVRAARASSTPAAYGRGCR